MYPDNDTVFTYNYRSDRMREITSLFAFEDKPIDVEIPKGLVSISNHLREADNAEHHHHVSLQPGVDPPRRFPSCVHGQCPGRVARQAGRQADAHCWQVCPFQHYAYSCSETEKYAHVTFFFNGGVEQQYTGEERGMVPSPKVATYDKQPEMSAQAVADKVAEVVKTNEFEFVMCNFAPPDMVRRSA
jgi:2,3-bisphosphoglycerate-independent phosphoglycerate mutase